MAKGTEQFKEVIKKHLDSIAAIDDNFAAKYESEGKSIDGCVEYIIGQVQKSGCNGFDDPEIYGMAVHYYEETDLGKYPKGTANVVVNHHIELTEEEKEEARKKAIASYEQEQLRKLQEKERKEKERIKKATEEKKAKEDAEGLQSLFD